MRNHPTCAVILAGGPGTRMGRLTAHRPKHLLPVAGQPFLAHQLQWLSTHGVTDVVVATSYLAEQFAPTLGDGSRWGVRLRYSTEPAPMGTGGGLAWATQSLQELPERLVVVNGDLLTDHDLSAQLDLARSVGESDAVLHIRTVPDARAFGSVVADGRGRVSSFTEKSDAPPSKEVNAGTYVLARELVQRIPSGVVSLEHDVLPACAERGGVLAYREQAMWEDVGTPAALVRASHEMVVASGRTAHVHPTAELAANASVSGGSAVSARARIRAGACVVGSVVMDGARVGVGALVASSVVGPGAQVPDGAAVVDGVVV